jgi:hypothetical protein
MESVASSEAPPGLTVEVLPLTPKSISQNNECLVRQLTATYGSRRESATVGGDFDESRKWRKNSSIPFQPWLSYRKDDTFFTFINEKTYKTTVSIVRFKSPHVYLMTQAAVCSASPLFAMQFVKYGDIDDPSEPDIYAVAAGIPSAGAQGDCTDQWGSGMASFTQFAFEDWDGDTTLLEGAAESIAIAELTDLLKEDVKFTAESLAIAPKREKRAVEDALRGVSFYESFLKDCGSKLLTDASLKNVQQHVSKSATMVSEIDAELKSHQLANLAEVRGQVSAFRQDWVNLKATKGIVPFTLVDGATPREEGMAQLERDPNTSEVLNALKDTPARQRILSILEGNILREDGEKSASSRKMEHVSERRMDVYVLTNGEMYTSFRSTKSEFKSVSTLFALVSPPQFQFQFKLDANGNAQDCIYASLDDPSSRPTIDHAVFLKNALDFPGEMKCARGFPR